MGSSGQIGAHQDEWDQVWQDYDRRRPAVVKPQPVTAPHPVAPTPATLTQVPTARRRNRGYGLLLAVSACLGLATLFGMPKASQYPAPAEAMASLASLAPEEAELPPLTVAVSRLAAESNAAACWVMRLAPQATPWAQPCVEP
jgi:hypothetical protein